MNFTTSLHHFHWRLCEDSVQHLEHVEVSEPSAELIHSGHCNDSEYGRLLVSCQQIPDVADLVDILGESSP